VPRTGNASLYDSAFTERSVLVLADIGDCRNLSVVAKNCHALSPNTDHLGSLLRNVGRSANLDKSVLSRAQHLSIDSTFPQASTKMQANDEHGA
jgi:hypothetical protein